MRHPVTSILSAFLYFYFVSATPASIAARDTISDHLDLGLASLLQTPPVHHDETFSHAIRIIHDYDRAPSCHRIATKALLDSCQALEPTDRSANNALDLVKSAFAARLAICELDGAGAAIPTACMPMVPRVSEDQSLLCRSTGMHCNQKQNKQHISFKPTSRLENNQCLRALESKPQWWTSYSNARQNAVLMCHAAREQIEQDQLLNTYRAMTETTEGLSAALAQQAAESLAHLAQQKTFASAIKEFQVQLTKDLEEERYNARGVFSSFAGEVQSEWHAVFNNIFGGANKMASKVDSINDDLDKATSNSANLHSNLHNLAQSIATREAELSQSHHATLAKSQDLSISVEDSLQQNKATVETMMVAMLEFKSDMNAIYSLISSMHTHHSDLSSRADSLTTAFEAVQSQVSSLQTDLTLFASSQNTTMNDFRSELEGARAIAAAFSESLSNLSVGGVAALLDSAWMIAQGVGVVLLVIAVEWIAGKVAARIVAGVCGCFILGNALASADPDKIITPAVAAVVPLVVFFGFAVASVSLVIYCLWKVVAGKKSKHTAFDMSIANDIEEKGKLLP